ncbi:hypothetical protein AMECASPLE_002878 [Ameca splendens]|uniref:Uncharacterized protein n=1 Tax=Ameca splendens TaxID=208324 RepID=A0ABV0XBH2_9TELE
MREVVKHTGGLHTQLSIELRFIDSLKTDGQVFCSGYAVPVVGVLVTVSCPGGYFVPQRGTAGPQTGSWADGTTPESYHHPDAAPGVGVGTIQSSSVSGVSGEPRDVDAGGVVQLSINKASSLAPC